MEHTGTISAFDRTITVKGDASISAADFNSAKAKLQTAMTDLAAELSPSAKTKMTNILDSAGFAIMIKTGNAGPAAADEKKTMTIGVNYLLSNDAIPTIAQAIVDKVITDDAFAVPVAYADFGGTQIPIYAGVGPSNETAAAKKSAIDTAYTSLGSAEQTRLKTKTTKIVIVNGTGYSATKATGVIELGKDIEDVGLALGTISATTFQD